MEAIDLFTPEMRDDPYPTYRMLREQAPVYREPRFGTWVLMRFDDVYSALRDHATFSSARGIAPGLRDSGGMGAGMTTMITSDPPRHSRLRSLVNRAFTPRTVARLEPMMRQVVDDLLAVVDGRPVDVVEVLTYPLPVIVIAHLMGIPPGDRDPKEFPEPDAFRLDRDLSLHVAFGYGIHYCLGAPLGRVEASIALNALLDRYAAIERTDEPAERLRSFLLRGFRRLPLRLTA